MRLEVPAVVFCFCLATSGSLPAAPIVQPEKLADEDINAFMAKKHGRLILGSDSDDDHFALLDVNAARIYLFDAQGGLREQSPPLDKAETDQGPTSTVPAVLDSTKIVDFHVGARGKVGLLVKPFFIYEFEEMGKRIVASFQGLPLVKSIAEVDDGWAVSVVPVPGPPGRKPQKSNRIFIYGDSGLPEAAFLEVGEIGSPTTGAAEVLLVVHDKKVKYAVERGSYRIYKLGRDRTITSIVEDSSLQFAKTQSDEERIAEIMAEEGFFKPKDLHPRAVPPIPPKDRREEYEEEGTIVAHTVILIPRRIVQAGAWDKHEQKLILVTTDKSGQVYLDRFDPATGDLLRWPLGGGWKASGISVQANGYVLLIEDNANQKVRIIKRLTLEDGEPVKNKRIVHVG